MAAGKWTAIMAVGSRTERCKACWTSIHAVNLLIVRDVQLVRLLLMPQFVSFFEHLPIEEETRNTSDWLALPALKLTLCIFGGSLRFTRCTLQYLLGIVPHVTDSHVHAYS